MSTNQTRIYGDSFETHFVQNITSMFRELLSTKHLYQSVKVDDDFIAGVAKTLTARQLRTMATALGGSGPSGAPPNEKHYEAEGRKLLTRIWVPQDDEGVTTSGVPRSIPRGTVLNSVTFRLPTVNTVCPHCGGNWPFNPVPSWKSYEVGQTPGHQWFFLSYECQNCKSEPIRFLVRRNGMRLTLCGRDPIEAVEVPKVIPKVVTRFFSSAMVAHQSGQTLAGLFLLRVCIEQYWRSSTAGMEAMKGISKPTGDELGAAYKATLPNDFKERFPTLAETYDTLSNALHTADANVATFEASRSNIERHFDAKRLFGLVDLTPAGTAGAGPPDET